MNFKLEFADKNICSEYIGTEIVREYKKKYPKTSKK
jgi:hypothetical protein